MLEPQILGPFLGRVGSLDARFIPDMAAAEISNVRIENGSIAPRYGYRNLVAAGSGFSAAFGLDYLMGFKTDGTKREEYLTIETRSGNTRAYGTSISGWTKAEIKNGVTSVNLTAADWRAVCIDDVAYLFCPSAPNVYRHTVGDATSLVAMVPPNQPTTPVLGFGGSYTFPGYASPTTIAYGGVATTGIVTGSGALQVTHTAADSTHANTQQGLGAATVTADFQAAHVQDWTVQVVYQWLMATPNGVFKIDPNSVGLTLTNNDGTPLDFTPNQINVKDLQNGSYLVTAYFDNKTAADWDNVRKVKFAYNVIACSATNANNTLTIGQIFLQGIDTCYGWTTPPAALKFAYTEYNSTSGFESALSVIEVPRAYFDSPRTSAVSDARTTLSQQTFARLTLTSSVDAGVDKFRIYYQAHDGAWYRVSEQSKTQTFYYCQIADADAIVVANLYRPATFRTDQVMSACVAKKAWMVWGYGGGGHNIQHAMVGYPEVQAGTATDSADETAPGSYSLRGDDPYAIHDTGDAIVILGAVGAYAQVGDRPGSMGPIKALPRSKATCGVFASCLWADDAGNPAVVWADPNGDVWMVIVSQQFDGNSGFRISEVASADRGLIKTLADAQSLAMSTVRMVVDEASDSVRIVVGAYMLKLARASLINDQRQWEVYKYTLGSSVTIGYVSGTVQRGLKWLRSNGKLDEAEVNSSSGAFITGSTRDDGAAMPSSLTYWRSKKFTGPRRRINRVRIERDTLTDTPTLKIYSDRQTDSKTWASGRKFVKFGPHQTGRTHQFEIQLPDTCAPVSLLDIEQFGPLSGRSDT